MADNSKKTSETKTATKAAKSKSPTLSKGIESTLKDFLSVIFESVNQSRETAQEALKEYYGTMQNYQLEFQRVREEEYRHLLGTVQESFGKEDIQTKFFDAQRTFTSNVEEKQVFLKKGVEEANQDYLKSLQEASTVTREACEAAYQDFLQATQKQLNNADLKAMQPDELAKVGQLLLIASQYANSFFGQQPAKS